MSFTFAMLFRTLELRIVKLKVGKADTIQKELSGNEEPLTLGNYTTDYTWKSRSV